MMFRKKDVKWLLNLPKRFKLAFGYHTYRFPQIIKWLFNAKETTNFTYALEERNLDYLASLLALVLKADYTEIRGYINEPLQDKELKDFIRKRITASSFSFECDSEPNFARRLGWYAIVRFLKPKVIIETGIDKGLGSILLCSALMKNNFEAPSKKVPHYYGTDINKDAGYLLGGDYVSFGTILFGDSIESLKKFDQKVDLFINDSDHSAEYEMKEYEIIKEKLSKDAIIIGDNAYVTDCLLKFSLREKRGFVFFKEEPKGHWYPGAGMGISISK
jgi:hypothetical protein